MTKNIAEIFENSGVKVEFKEGDLVVDCLLLMRVVEADGSMRISMAWSSGQDFIVRRGMIEEARDAISSFSNAD